MPKLSCPACGHHIGDIDITTGGSRIPGDLLGKQPLIRAFVNDACDTSAPDIRTPSADLYGAFTTWAKDHPLGDVSQRTFGMVIRGLGFEPYRDKTARYYLGIKPLG